MAVRQLESAFAVPEGEQVRHNVDITDSSLQFEELASYYMYVYV